jgi:hypothetical protein
MVTAAQIPTSTQAEKEIFLDMARRTLSLLNAQAAALIKETDRAISRAGLGTWRQYVLWLLHYQPQYWPAGIPPRDREALRILTTSAYVAEIVPDYSDFTPPPDDVEPKVGALIVGLSRWSPLKVLETFHDFHGLPRKYKDQFVELYAPLGQTPDRAAQYGSIRFVANVRKWPTEYIEGFLLVSLFDWWNL